MARCRTCGEVVDAAKTGERGQVLVVWHLNQGKPCMGSQAPPEDE